MNAIFLDRDGTIIKQKKGYYITSVKQVKIFRSAPKALQMLQQAGYKLIIFTNQACVAHGLITEKELVRINRHIQNLYLKEGIRFDKIYYCPHHREGKITKYRKVCSCRKPAIGMLLTAKRETGINLKKSFVIGDSMRDMEAGKKVGARTILVLTGYGREMQSKLKRNQHRLIDYITTNLLGAARLVVNH